MKLYVFTGGNKINYNTYIFSSQNRALIYANNIIDKQYKGKRINIDIQEVKNGLQILLTDFNAELIETYFILEREVDDYVEDI